VLGNAGDAGKGRVIALCNTRERLGGKENS
jgi:hypothetical protein